MKKSDMIDISMRYLKLSLIDFVRHSKEDNNYWVSRYYDKTLGMLHLLNCIEIIDDIKKDKILKFLTNLECFGYKQGLQVYIKEIKSSGD